jgi:hypothetical protein
MEPNILQKLSKNHGFLEDEKTNNSKKEILVS